MDTTRRKLVFENGRAFTGEGFGAVPKDAAIAEVVFNTSMVGYQEIISDPSCCGQMLCMTYPLIGNYGLADEDYESRGPCLSGLIVREYNDQPSNFRYTRTLSDLMAEHGVPGIAGVDTRAITRMLQGAGSMRAILTDVDMPDDAALAQLHETPVPRDQVARVSCQKLWHSRTANYRYNVVALDCGIKFGIIRSLNALGCNVSILPHDASAADVLALHPDGLLISNGPGSPEDVPEAVAVVKALQGRLPIFGISLGNLIIALANGAAAYKMKCGHHGGNHPVRNLVTGRVEITSQGHGHAVDGATLMGTGLHLTHLNLLDGTVEGIANNTQRMFGVQFHPESAPGPQDSDALFGRFIAFMEAERQQTMSVEEVRHA